MGQQEQIFSKQKRLLQDVRGENEYLKSQTETQQDTIFDVQSQVRYLQSELIKGNSRVKELKEKLDKLSIDHDTDDPSESQ